jgi:hypothetical protein
LFAVFTIQVELSQGGVMAALVFVVSYGRIILLPCLPIPFVATSEPPNEFKKLYPGALLANWLTLSDFG